LVPSWMGAGPRKDQHATLLSPNSFTDESTKLCNIVILVRRFAQPCGMHVIWRLWRKKSEFRKLQGVTGLWSRFNGR
ncbi:hypothetical protein COCMIDRAFT_86043, partial [Bipolaris oryzae ATCC 44560]